jgi:SAM-dependent methyltransferase
MQLSGTKPEHSQAIEAEPWQLRLFRRSLKKQLKLKALLEMLGSLDGQQCLLVTCGDNNGAMNWHLKQHSGSWSWADAERDSIQQIHQVTGDPVAEMDKRDPALPFPDGAFDTVMTIDVHEHLERPQALNAELARLTRPGGRVIVTTPNGDRKKLANRIKLAIGMRPEDYGHVVMGYDLPELESQLFQAGLSPYGGSSYSRFFTEMLELAINTLYVKVLARRSRARVEKGQIAPQNIEQIRSVEKTLKLYSLVYPVMAVISRLDVLDRSQRGYAVIVAARKA